MPPTAEEQAAADAAAAEKAASEAAEAAKAAEGEEFDKDRALATIKAQRESEAAAKKQAQELAAKLKEYEDRDKTEQQKLAEAKEQAEKDAAAATQELMKYRVAAAKGLNPKLADLLTGSTQEEMEAKADLLLEHAKPPVDPSTFDGGARGPAPEEKDPAKLAAAVPRRW